MPTSRYDLLALDLPLPRHHLRQLRLLAPRATVTPTRFSSTQTRLTTEPNDLLARYFDVFVQTSSSGTVRAAFRLPHDTIDPTECRAFLVPPHMRVEAVDRGIIIDLSRELERPPAEGDDGISVDDIAPARDELLHGDMRPLYIAWLASVTAWDVTDDEYEPPVPLGLGELSDAQAALATLLGVDDGLLQAAAEASPQVHAQPDDGLGLWIAEMSADEKDRLLFEVARGHGRHVGAMLLRRFRRTVAAEVGIGTDQRRTAKQLRDAAERASDRRGSRP